MSTAIVIDSGSSSGLVEPVGSAPFEEHGERPVVQCDVLHAAHERRATRPVGGVAVVESGFAECSGEGVGAARRHAEAEPAQELGEGDGDVGR